MYFCKYNISKSKNQSLATSCFLFISPSPQLSTFVVVLQYKQIMCIADVMSYENKDFKENLENYFKKAGLKIYCVHF